jgi:Leucine-rich repeat (LRR) protein
MFIKKDLRKVPEILSDAADAARASKVNEGGGSADAGGVIGPLRSLHLARRKDEFPNGKVRCLTEPSATEAKILLQQVEALSLYDCEISDVEGLGPAMSNLQDLCLGRNPLASLPDDFSVLTNLQRLWLDDCRLECLPSCILDLSNLQELRASHNRLTELPDNLNALVDLKVLCVDHNHIESLPAHLPPFLTTLQVRENQLTSLPVLPSTLKLLQASSNRISSVGETSRGDDELTTAVQPLLMDLTHAYLNSNELTHVPAVFLTGCHRLKRLNLSNNLIAELPVDFRMLHGLPDEHGICSDNVVWIVDNPVVEMIHSPTFSTTTLTAASGGGDDDDDDAIDMEDGMGLDPATATASAPMVLA